MERENRKVSALTADDNELDLLCNYTKSGKRCMRVRRPSTLAKLAIR